MFRFAYVEGHSALVDSDGRWFDASRVSRGIFAVDPTTACRQLQFLGDGDVTTTIEGIGTLTNQYLVDETVELRREL